MRIKGQVRPWFVVLAAAAGVVATLGVIVVLGYVADPLGAGFSFGPPGAESSLEHSVPAPDDGKGRFLGYDRFTADELNRIHQGSELRRIRFVTADVPSTGPDVVSVNPIDAYTWGAAALSPNGRCYVLVAVIDRTDTRFGADHYGWLAKGAKCVGSAATPTKATADTWPDQMH